MQCDWNGSGPRKPGGQRDGGLRVLGVVLFAAGCVVLLVCVPGWAWVALTGLALIAAGCLAFRLSRKWR